jgi:HSP20 family protein
MWKRTTIFQGPVNEDVHLGILKIANLSLLSGAKASERPDAVTGIQSTEEVLAVNNMVRQNPWSLVPRLQEEVKRLYGDSQEGDSSSATAAWVPAVDIIEYADRFEIYVDVPGLDPNQVELTLEAGVLAISGQRSEPAQAHRKEAPEYQRIERSQGQFYRRFLLPDTVDSDKVNAVGKNGVLTITIPKQSKAMPRRIQIGS